MPRFYSDHYTSDGIDQLLPQSVFVKNAEAIDGGFIRYKRCRLDTTTSTKTPDAVPLGIQLRLLTLHSSIRPIALYLSTPGGFEVAMDADIGIHLPGVQNDGGGIDQDLFVNNLSIDTARNRLEMLIGIGGNLADKDRGLTLWEMVNVAQPGKYARDPLIDLQLAIKIGTTAGAGDDLIMELYYT